MSIHLESILVWWAIYFWMTYIHSFYYWIIYFILCTLLTLGHSILTNSCDSCCCIFPSPHSLSKSGRWWLHTRGITLCGNLVLLSRLGSIMRVVSLNYRDCSSIFLPFNYSWWLPYVLINIFHSYPLASTYPFDTLILSPFLLESLFPAFISLGWEIAIIHHESWHFDIDVGRWCVISWGIYYGHIGRWAWPLSW